MTPWGTYCYCILHIRNLNQVTLGNLQGNLASSTQQLIEPLWGQAVFRVDIQPHSYTIWQQERPNLHFLMQFCSSNRVQINFQHLLFICKFLENKNYNVYRFFRVYSHFVKIPVFYPHFMFLPKNDIVHLGISLCHIISGSQSKSLQALLRWYNKKITKGLFRRNIPLALPLITSVT